MMRMRMMRRDLRVRNRVGRLMDVVVDHVDGVLSLSLSSLSRW